MNTCAKGPGFRGPPSVFLHSFWLRPSPLLLSGLPMFSRWAGEAFVRSGRSDPFCCHVCSPFVAFAYGSTFSSQGAPFTWSFTL
eukprot:16446821-Heterocapsa_arctica.AAC.1